MTDVLEPASRRRFIQGAAGLVLGLYLAPRGAQAQAMEGGGGFAPNAFLRVAPDSTVTVISKHTEMGQGPMTGLTTIVAEELDADWGQMRVETAPADVKLYANTNLGLQGTGGSSAVANSWDQLRNAGATARALLVKAAAERWKVPAAEISVDKGVVRHGVSARTASFGELAVAASKLPAPDKVVLKDAARFRLIGREGAVKKLDVPAKTDGSAIFGQDVHEPDMLTVVVAHPPRYRAKVTSFDDSVTRAVRGVVDVRQLPGGVAVYARGTWPAIKGRKALKVSWDEAGTEARGTERIFADLQAMTASAGKVAKASGDVDAALKAADRLIERTYVFPFLAHAPMEPLNATLIWDGKTARARFGSQLQTIDQQQIAGVLGLKPEDVAIETLFAGGSFGRRIDLGNDMLSDLAHAAKAIGPGRPVKLVWTREDDIQGGFYRPVMVHRMRAALKDGRITGWANTVAGQAWAKGTMFENFLIKDGIDSSMVEGAAELPYAVSNFRCDAHICEVGAPTSSWRSVGSTHTAYAVECFIDELLTATGKDPIAGRIELSKEDPRYGGVLTAVAEMSGWNRAKPAPGRARGVATAKAFGTYVAQVAEVSVGDNGEPRVHKVWCAVDCGQVVNPDVVRAQMEGGIGFGLGHILFAEVPLEDGRPTIDNFDGYRSMRIQEMPEIEVRTIASAARPTGVGEPGVPPIGPAVANALAALGHERPTRLPMVRRTV